LPATRTGRPPTKFRPESRETDALVRGVAYSKGTIIAVSVVGLARCGRHLNEKGWRVWDRGTRIPMENRVE